MSTTEIKKIKAEIKAKRKKVKIIKKSLNKEQLHMEAVEESIISPPRVVGFTREQLIRIDEGFLKRSKEDMQILIESLKKAQEELKKSQEELKKAEADLEKAEEEWFEDFQDCLRASFND